MRYVDYFDFGVNNDWPESVDYKVVAWDNTILETTFLTDYIDVVGWTCLDLYANTCVDVMRPTSLCRKRADGESTRRQLDPFRDVEFGGNCQCDNGFERTNGGFCRETCGDGKMMSMPVL